MARFRAVLFDAGGTLYALRAGRPARFQQALARAGLAVDEQALVEAVALADSATGWPDAVPRGTRAEEDALWLRYCDLVWDRLACPPDPALRRALAAECRWLRWVEPYPDTLPALQRLHGQARLGVVSNNVPSLLEALDSLGLARFFDDVVVSVLVGLSKPDPAIYTLALARLGVLPGEALFVDDLEENVRAARAVGLEGVLIDRDGQLAAAADLPLVRTLDELASLALGERAPR